MGSILNPGNDNSFARLIYSKEKGIFVDKTDFIEKTNDIIDSESRFIAVTRPRRFGKTVTAHMLAAYYSGGCNSEDLFRNLKISESSSYKRHLNNYNVIYWDMNSIKDGYKERMNSEILQKNDVNSIVDYLQFITVLELKQVESFRLAIDKNPFMTGKSLKTALGEICKETQKKFILIMDEWDLIYREYRNNANLQKDFIEFMQSLFKSDEGQNCFSLAYLTGILPIKKYNSQSALNTFDEYNMLTPGNLASYFGFTEDEVAKIVKSPQCRLSQNELREWYEGYKINDIAIYNPNSVCKAVSRNECIGYWSGTSSNEEVINLINLNYGSIKDDILRLIEGEEIGFSYGSFQNDLVNIKSEDDIFCLLVCLGYLGCRKNETASEKSDEFPDISECEKNTDTGTGSGNASLPVSLKNKNRRTAYVPNNEVRFALIDIVKHQNWYNRMKTIRRSETLLRAIRELDGDKTAEIIQEIHNSSAVSLYDYNDEKALIYCIMTGLLWSALDDYICHREDQAGKGKVDLVYEPASRKDPLILIEFKYDCSAEEALKQIKTREYYKRYTDLYSNVILAGISYSRKTKDHRCLIERLDT